MKGPQARVLIVEDDPLVSRMIQGLLEEIGYTIAGKARDGSHALELTQTLHPDVILMDIKMPDTDGIAAARLILERCPTPIVVLSAYETSELLHEASAAGVGAYLVKPPDARELERAISISIARFDDMMSLRRQKAELEALSEASLRLTAQLDLQAVLEALLQQVLGLIKADDTHIFFFDGENLTFGAALWADSTQEQPISSPRPSGLTHTVAHTGRRIVIPNVDTHPLFKDWKWGGAIAGLPLRVGEQVIGVMNIAFQQPHTFADSELRLLESLAAQAAIAIQNARLYEQVQRHATELEQRVQERTQALTEANARLQELDRLKTQFINDISHELRTPATNVRLYLDLLERGRREKQDQYLEVIKGQTDQMVRLVENILHFSQLQLNETRLTFVPVDLNRLVGRTAAAYQARAEALGLAFFFEPEADLPPVHGEPAHLNRILTILLDNALKYTPAGEVRVRTCALRERGQARLEVVDTGRGISPADMPHIFERFYRGRGVGSSNIPGTGLGLSLAQEIVKLHRGEITVESRAGHGSTFAVYLPLQPEQSGGGAA